MNVFQMSRKRDAKEIDYDRLFLILSHYNWIPPIGEELSALQLCAFLAAWENRTDRPIQPSPLTLGKLGAIFSLADEEMKPGDCYQMMIPVVLYAEEFFEAGDHFDAEHPDSGDIGFAAKPGGIDRTKLSQAQNEALSYFEGILDSDSYSAILNARKGWYRAQN